MSERETKIRVLLASLDMVLRDKISSGGVKVKS